MSKGSKKKREKMSDFAEGGFVNDRSGKATAKVRKTLNKPAPKRTKKSRRGY